jgi:2-methylfumaryl-CoA isomerase
MVNSPSPGTGGATAVPGLPLAGIRVIEVGSFVAVPSAGLTLRQLGARVIRVDPVGGAPDVGRWPLGRDGRSLYWAGLNRGKESVVLDLAAARGQELLRRLVAAGGPGGGILLSNVAGQPWLADAVLRRGRPDLIYAQVLGRPGGASAVDYTINAASGLAHATGPAAGPGPVNGTLPAWDLLAGSYTASAVLAALRRRDSSGHGAFLQISLEDVAMATLTTLGFLPEAHLTGSSRPPLGNHVYGTFGVDLPLADGTSVMLVALTPRHWRSLVQVTGTGRAVGALEAALEADFSREGDRYTHRHVLVALLRPWFEARNLEEVAAALRGSPVLWSPFRRFTDVVAELVAAPGSSVVTEITEDGLGEVLATTGPVRGMTGTGAAMWPGAAGPGAEPGAAGPGVAAEPGVGPGAGPGVAAGPGAAPRLGQDTDAVLAELLDGEEPSSA